MVFLTPLLPLIFANAKIRGRDLKKVINYVILLVEESITFLGGRIHAPNAKRSSNHSKKI
jgi:hypothetical protein